MLTPLLHGQSELEQAVPSSAISLTSGRAELRNPNSMQSHARQLRVLLESLDDMQRSRTQLVSRATRLAASEDITPRILKAASAIERWVEVQPSMFEDVLDEELAKYDKFRDEIEEGQQPQEVLLESIKVPSDVTQLSPQLNLPVHLGTQCAVRPISQRGSIRQRKGTCIAVSGSCVSQVQGD